MWLLQSMWLITQHVIYLIWLQFWIDWQSYSRYLQMITVEKTHLKCVILFILFKNSCSDSQNNAFLFTFKFKTSPIIKNFQSRICVPLRKLFIYNSTRSIQCQSKWKRSKDTPLVHPQKSPYLQQRVYTASQSSLETLVALAYWGAQRTSHCTDRKRERPSGSPQTTPWSIRKHSKTGASASVYVCIRNCMC